MPLTSLITSIESPEGSSGGASPTDFMRRCNPDIFRAEFQSWGTGSQVNLGWQQDVTGARFLHAVSVPTHQVTGRRVGFSENLRFRILCHLLINHIPDKGLVELCESMARIFEFYIDPVESEIPALPERRGIRGRIGRAYERPEFCIADE